MKFTRIFALAIACVMLAVCAASCGGTTVTNITLKITVPAEDASGVEQIVDASVAVNGKAPTVLDAMAVASELCDFTYTTNDAGTSVEQINDFARYTDDETGLNYSWYFTINAVEPAGSASDNTLKEGDVLEYIYNAYDPSK